MVGGARLGGGVESSKENVYYSDFVYGNFSKHEIKHTEINIGLKKKHLEALGGVRKTPNNGNFIKR